ncbi:uncharacterized protein F4807DRAFT_463325 [Annulohypoxylon truncatum]|uniref:uncharacterized protein n=1 Tax=Annulohypoxylon truncatum TaxID=327061 RepID=UPI00200763BA|nr:uncharacterized protein F4807DRAFT_463325 [Annulohypoxylon truncatum]KAI1206924.1 hypothetical protein F4807DRAFT_463325 [Annulohypoxylon truncatum]
MIDDWYLVKCPAVDERQQSYCGDTIRILTRATEVIVTSYVACISERRWHVVPLFFARDTNWWINENPARVPQAADGTAAERLPDTQSLLGRFDTYSFEVLRLVAKRNRTDVEVMATEKGSLDLVYINNVTMTFLVVGEGRIETLREYPEYNELNWVLE